MNFTPIPNETVDEAAARLYPGNTYDTALPQQWVDALYTRGLDPRGHMIWLYPKGFSGGRCAPITERGIEIASLLATYAR
jgi:hypothetical protein